ncbi:MAG: DUF1003 domain-containing protein [Patescibacteria group bacterium]
MQSPTPTELFFERLTSWVGSVPSLIIHTIVFIAAFGVAFLGIAAWDTVLLMVTTVVSLEAIYISILIQMTVNRQAKELHEVSEDVEEISKEVEEIGDDVEEISKDVDEIQEDVEVMTEDWDLESGLPAQASKPRTPESVTIEQLTADVKKILASLESLKK